MASLSFLGVLAWSCLLAPFVVGTFALVDLQRFRREAFGRYRASIGWFMVAITASLACHAVIVAAFAALGFVERMHVGPPAPLGGVLYAQSLLSCLALAAARRSGSHLRVIVQPAPAPASPTVESA